MPPALGDRERFVQNHAWFEAHFTDLLSRYPGRFVAVDGEKVLADASSVQELARRFGHDAGILITRVIRPEDEQLFVF